MNNSSKQSKITNLRQKAEALLKKNSSETGLSLSETETLKLVHELEVRQIELELTNEELMLASSAAQNASEKYSELFDFAPSGYFILSKGGKIIDLNICGAQMLGNEPAHLKNSQFDFFVTNDTKPIFNLFLEKAFSSKVKETCEVILSINGNLPVYTSLTGVVTKNSEQCLVTLVDITESKRVQALLQYERDLNLDIIKSQPSGIYRIRVAPKEKWLNNAWISKDHQPYTYDFINDRFCEILGVEKEILINNPGLIVDLVHPDDRAEYKQKNEEANENLTPFKWECRLIVDGKIIWAHFESLPRLLDNGEVLWTGFLYDITERKQSEEKIIKLSRVNLVLSNVNQSIVHIRDKQELFNQVCKIAIEDGKLRMAWIGIINPQTNKVDVVASYGIVNGYLDSVDIDLNYPVRSKGPTGKSINTAQHYYSNSIKTDEAMLPWRENAVSRGYNSAISLPLFLAGKVIGNFTLYSEEENYFNPEEIELLDKLAMNISFAMDYLENESERKNAEDALRESKSKLDAALASTTDAIFITDAEGNYIEYNDAFVKYLRFSSKDELLANFNDFSDIIQVNYSNGEIAPSEMWAVPRALRGETATNVEYKLLRKDTGESWVGSYSFSPMRDDKGEIVGSVVVARDVTELKQAENDLRESEQKLSTLFASMTEMVAIHELVFNEEGEAINYIITDCNDAFCRNIGIKKENIIGRLANEVYQTEKAPFLETYTRVTITGKSFEHNIYYPPLDKHFLISAVSPGKNMFSTITNDITVIQKAHEEIDQKNKELENYIYVASHDLRSPLVNIQGFSQRLQKQTEEIKYVLTANEPDKETKDSLAKITNETLPKTLDFILTNVKKMDTLINGLLQVSRTGRITMVITKIDMNRLINTILSHYSFQITEMKAEVSSTDLPDCYGDENQLNQLFSNIIGNALKYRDKNRPLELKIAAKTHYNKVIYSISDTGIGIHQRDIEKIWNVFYRVDSTVSEAGDGIGLSLVKRIADKHKGKIWVESEEGKGSTFYVELQKNEFVE